MYFPGAVLCLSNETITFRRTQIRMKLLQYSLFMHNQLRRFLAYIARLHLVFLGVVFALQNTDTVGI